VDRSGDRAQEEKTLFEVPNVRAGERVSVQRVRVQAEALGAGPEPGAVRTPGKNMVPEQTHEEQEEQPATGRATATAAATTATAAVQQQQQQRQRQRQSPAPHAGDRRPPRQRAHQTPSVTVALLWSRRRRRPPTDAHAPHSSSTTAASPAAAAPPSASLPDAIRLSTYGASPSAT